MLVENEKPLGEKLLRNSGMLEIEVRILALLTMKNSVYTEYYMRIASRPCNLSYFKAVVLGWLEDRNPPWRLLVPLW